MKKLFTPLLMLLCLAMSHQSLQANNEILNEMASDSVCYTIQTGECPYEPNDSIFQTIILGLPYCCDESWDGICQILYDDLANSINPDSTSNIGCLSIVNGQVDYEENDFVFQFVSTSGGGLFCRNHTEQWYTLQW